jgi:hypothetical protein
MLMKRPLGSVGKGKDELSASSSLGSSSKSDSKNPKQIVPDAGFPEPWTANESPNLRSLAGIFRYGFNATTVGSSALRDGRLNPRVGPFY